MSIVELDGRLIKTPADFHKQIALALDFGPYYGGNLAALWDMLSANVERPVVLIWNESAISCQQMGKSNFNSIVKILKDTQKQDKAFGWEDTFDFELK